MMEDDHEMAQPLNLTSMTDDEFFELVWENGQLLMRNLPRRAQRSPSCNGHPSNNAHVHVKNGGDTFPQKKARFETLDSVLDDPFYVFLEQNKGDNSSVKYHKESQVVPEYADLETGCDSNYIAETPQLARRRQPDKPSAKQYQELAPFERSMANSTLNLVTTREVPVAKLPEQDLKSGGKRVTCNFSSFLGPPALHHVNGQKTGPAALSSAKDRNNNCKRSSPCGNINPLESMPIAPANGSKTVEGFHYQPNFMEPTVELLPLGAKPTDRLLPDNESEAVRRDYASPNQVYGQTSMVAANKAKQKFTNTQKASSSLCSGGASNNPTHTLKRRHDDTEGSADHPSQNIERKAKNVTKAVPGTMNKARSMTSVAPGSKRKRKNRTAEFHNISERKRRDKINEKMRALRKLIPNCNKVDKASMLDEAIEYLKILQLQVQMMSMGNRVCIPQMVLPDGMQQTSPQQMTHFSPMRMQMGVGCNPFPVPPNFLFPPIPGATAVPGFPPQLLPMSLLPAQLALLNPSGSLPGVSLASAPTPLMASVNLSNSKDSIHNINSEEGKKQSC